MTDFNNPVYRKKLAQQQAPMKEFVVDDSPFTDQNQTNDRSFFEQTFSGVDPENTMELTNKVKDIHRDIHKLKNETVDRVPELARKNLLLLANLGRQTKDVKIGAATFTLQTLKSRETAEITAISITKENNIQMALEMRRQNLARSICKIDNADLVNVLANDSIQSRLMLVDELGEVVVRKLAEEFDNLVAESTKAINSVEEVVETIKK